MKKLGWIALAALVVSPLAVVSDAEACGGAIFRESRPTPKPSPATLVAKAEKQAEEGKTDAALKTALDAFPKLEKAVAGKNAIENRALRLAAISAVRSGGELSVVGAKAGASYYDYDYGRDVNVPAKLAAVKTDADKLARKEWAIKALRSVATQLPDNPSVKGELGEALAAVPGNEEEALTVLSELAEKDLLGTPEAYAALARLRFEQGLTKKSAEAVSRCNAMTNKPAVCGVQLPVNPA
jgi:hypothetical protein